MLILTRVKDPRVQGVTMTGTRVTGDLKQAKVYFSVLGGQGEVERAQAGLDSAKGFIKREIGLRLKLRYMPDITFIHDPSLESGTRMELLFKELNLGDEE